MSIGYNHPKTFGLFSLPLCRRKKVRTLPGFIMNKKWLTGPGSMDPLGKQPQKAHTKYGLGISYPYHGMELLYLPT